MMGISGAHINDGRWHTVVLELNRTFSSLTLDSRHTEGSRGPPMMRSPAAGISVYFGALVQFQRRVPLKKEASDVSPDVLH